MSAIPDFSSLPLEGGTAGHDRDDRRVPVEAATGWQGDVPEWVTPEGIVVGPHYTGHDLEPVEHLESLPGFPPYLRGPYPTMYVTRPWTVRRAP